MLEIKVDLKGEDGPQEVYLPKTSSWMTRGGRMVRKRPMVAFLTQPVWLRFLDEFPTLRNREF